MLYLGETGGLTGGLRKAGLNVASSICFSTRWTVIYLFLCHFQEVPRYLSTSRPPPITHHPPLIFSLTTTHSIRCVVNVMGRIMWWICRNVYLVHTLGIAWVTYPSFFTLRRPWMRNQPTSVGIGIDIGGEPHLSACTFGRGLDWISFSTSNKPIGIF